MNNRYGKITRIVNYLFIFLAINYTIVVNFITHIDSAGYALVLLSIIVLFLNGSSIRVIYLKKPVIFWLLWCIFVTFNYFIHSQPYPLTLISLIRMVYIPLILLIIVDKEYRINSHSLIWICLITHIVYTIGGYYFDSNLLYRETAGNDNTLGNLYAINVSFTLFYLALLNRIGKLSWLWFIVLTLVVVLVLALSGTRKAFGAGLIILVFWALSYFSIRKVRTWFFVLLFAFLGMKGYTYLLENTFMGARIEVLEKQREENLPPGAPQFLNVFGDRSGHYYYGIKQFLERPITGSGLKQSRVAGNKDLYFHTEYVAQLVDNGLIGFFLFFALYFWTAKRILRKKNQTIKLCMIGGYVSIMFLMLTAWAWEFPAYFICLGVLVGYCQCDNYDIINENKYNHERLKEKYM